MSRPVTTTIDGVRLPATPRGCTPFPAVGKYPRDWTLHVVADYPAGVLSPSVNRAEWSGPGTDAPRLNHTADRAHALGATVFAWVTHVDDPPRDADGQAA